MKKSIILISLILTFSSCFKNFFRFEQTQEWDSEKMKKLHESEKHFVVHFINGLKKISMPNFSHNQVSGRLDSYQSLKVKSSRYTYAEPDTTRTEHQFKVRDKDKVLSEVHIFIAEEYRDQDTVVINKANFIRMREYKMDRDATVMSHIGSAVGVLALILLLSTIAYYTTS